MWALENDFSSTAHERMELWALENNLSSSAHGTRGSGNRITIKYVSYEKDNSTLSINKNIEKCKKVVDNHISSCYYIQADRKKTTYKISNNSKSC